MSSIYGVIYDDWHRRTIEGDDVQLLKNSKFVLFICSVIVATLF